MIDRGDLSAEIGEHKLFNAVQTISKVVKRRPKLIYDRMEQTLQT